MSTQTVDAQEERVESPTWDDIYALVSGALGLVFDLQGFDLQGDDENDPEIVGIRGHLAKAMILINRKQRRS